MAGSKPIYRHLSRDSAHRRALLRNLVTSLIEHESISTTWHKAKEAQRLAEKMITYAKKNTKATKFKAKSYLFKPILMRKLFGPLRKRYESRPGGYTRVLRIEPLKEDQAPSAILEFVDSPKDMRMMMTAYTIAKTRQRGQEINDMTAANIQKCLKYRKDGENMMHRLVRTFERVGIEDDGLDMKGVQKKRVYPDLPRTK